MGTQRMTLAPLPTSPPAHGTSPERMESVVVALQGSPRDDAAVDFEAAELARRTCRALVAVRVVPPSDRRVSHDFGPLSYLGERRLLPGWDERLAFAAAAGRQAGIEVKTELIAAADPAAAIADSASRHDAAVILVEPPGGGFRSRVQTRGLARRLRRHARAPVFVAGAQPPEDIH